MENMLLDDLVDDGQLSHCTSPSPPSPQSPPAKKGTNMYEQSVPAAYVLINTYHCTMYMSLCSKTWKAETGDVYQKKCTYMYTI